MCMLCEGVINNYCVFPMVCLIGQLVPGVSDSGCTCSTLALADSTRQADHCCVARLLLPPQIRFITFSYCFLTLASFRVLHFN